MQTAVIHDWLISIGGGEKVLEAVLNTFPSPIYTLIYDNKKFEKSNISKQIINTSFLQNFPKSKSKYQWYLPFFPHAIEQFDLSKHEVVLSFSHCVAKGVITNADQLHICYCHTPMRYAWDLYHQYLAEEKGLKAKIIKAFLHYLRIWDSNSSNRVDYFLGNSKYIARRIEKIYRRKADFLYPPIDTKYFSFHDKKEGYYLTASRLVSYKKIGLIVEAFSCMPKKKLLVIGDGPEMDKIKRKAAKNIEILGYQNNDKLKDYLQRAKAFVFAAIEDFGILPVEAQACGTPVIALRKGGAKETVLEDKTGVFFEKQKVEDIIKAVERFEKKEKLFDLKDIRAHAETFSVERFQREYKNYIDQKYKEFKERF